MVSEQEYSCLHCVHYWRFRPCRFYSSHRCKGSKRWQRMDPPEAASTRPPMWEPRVSGEEEIKHSERRRDE